MGDPKAGVDSRIAAIRRLTLFVSLAIAAILTAITADYPAAGSWQLPVICLAMYLIALFMLLALPRPGLGSGFAIGIASLLAAGSGALAFVLWALAQGEVSTSQDRRTVWIAAAACVANLGLVLAALRYSLALKDLCWWHVLAGIALAIPPAWILMARIM